MRLIRNSRCADPAENAECAEQPLNVQNSCWFLSGCSVMQSLRMLHWLADRSRLATVVAPPQA